MLNYIAKKSSTSVATLSQKTWPELVDFILLHLAGGSNRWCIHKNFMTFMSLYGKECIDMDKKTGYELAPVLFTVAMQRLSKGAVLHDVVRFDQQLPAKFWVYSSAHDDYHIMTDDCLQFIYEGLPVATQFKATSDYALKIAWGLAEHLDENGQCYGGFTLDCQNPIENGKKLYASSIKIIEENLPADKIFDRYATPSQWEKHKMWLKTHIEDWNIFFRKIGVSTSIFNLREKTRIIREIRNA